MYLKASFMMGFVALAVAVGGCCEQEKQRIGQLTQDNETLAEQLRMANEQLDLKDAELARCRGEVSSIGSRVNDLQSRLREAQQQKPQLPTGWQVKKGMAMTSLENKVLFDPGSAKLKKGAAVRLDRVLNEIKRSFPGREVYIIGHTDSDPIRVSKWKDNLELSLHRAAEVGRYMLRRGLTAKDVVVGGCGENRPVASNQTAKGKAANRRVEFWILGPVR